jgi:hypothetical protein
MLKPFFYQSIKLQVLLHQPQDEVLRPDFGLVQRQRRSHRPLELLDYLPRVLDSPGRFDIIQRQLADLGRESHVRLALLQDAQQTASPWAVLSKGVDERQGDLAFADVFGEAFLVGVLCIFARSVAGAYAEGEY